MRLLVVIVIIDSVGTDSDCRAGPSSDDSGMSGCRLGWVGVT
jgi:hypothetical protein